MNLKVKNIFLLACALIVVLLAFAFFSRADVIEVSAPLVTRQDIEKYQEQQKVAQQHKQQTAEARRKAEMRETVYKCETDDECIIVDKHPCGCLNGPEGVTAINATYSFNFLTLVEKEYGQATRCGEVASTERECSATARAVCEENRCRIVY